MAGDRLLWRCYHAANELIEALHCSVNEGYATGSLDQAEAFLGVMAAYMAPLLDAVDAVKEHERRCSADEIRCR